MTYYWILYAYQFIGIIFLTYTLISLENYQIYCMVSAATQIEIIGTRLKKLGYRIDSKNENEKAIVCKQREDFETLMELVQCVKDHKFLMKYTFSFFIKSNP